MWPKEARMRSRTRGSDAGAEESLIGWRRRQLLRAGFEVDLAARIASDRSMDLHALLELVDMSCPPGLAARILAPLEYEAPQC